MARLRELFDGVNDDAKVVVLWGEQGVGNLLPVEPAAAFGGDGSQQHGHGGRFRQVATGFLLPCFPAR